MFNSSTGLFSFQFSSMDGLNAMLENGLWFIRNHPLILKKWKLDVNLLKEDVGNVPVWVKLHGITVAAFSEDGLSAIATKLDVELKDTIVVAMSKIAGVGFYIVENVEGLQKDDDDEISNLVDLHMGRSLRLTLEDVDGKILMLVTCHCRLDKGVFQPERLAQVSSGYGVLVFIPSWSFVKCRHRYAVSSLMDMTYRMSESVSSYFFIYAPECVAFSYSSPSTS
ncbi:hypothetical protein Tco_0931945 [Tanacetum coccineum]